MRNLGFISEGGRDVRSGNGRGRDAIIAQSPEKRQCSRCECGAFPNSAAPTRRASVEEAEAPTIGHLRACHRNPRDTR